MDGIVGWLSPAILNSEHIKKQNVKNMEIHTSPVNLSVVSANGYNVAFGEPQCCSRAR
jgi:hypothetical protein